MNKTAKWLLISAPILLAGLYVGKKTGLFGKAKGQPKKPSDTAKDSDIETKGTGEVKPAVVKYFPMAKGSRGEKVRELQQAILANNPAALPKYKDDGDFGTETETEVLKLLGKKTVDGQEDIEKIKNLKKTAEAQRLAKEGTANRVTLANQLKAALAKGRGLSVYADHDVQVFQGAIESGTGREIQTKTVVKKAGDKIVSSGDISLVTVEPGGNMTFKILSSSQTKPFVRVSPYAIYLK